MVDVLLYHAWPIPAHGWAGLLSFDQRLASLAVFDHRAVTGDELFTDLQVGAERALGDHHAPVLPLDHQVALVTEEIHHLAQDGSFHRVVGAQVKLGMLAIDGDEPQEQVECIPDPVMPDIGEAELELGVFIHGWHIIRLERDLTLVHFIPGPDVEQVIPVR